MTTRQLFVAIFLLALFALSAKSVTDPDFGWHLRTGEYIVTTQSIPHADLFSLTAAGEPWITHEWLVEVAIYLLFRIGGHAGLVLFFALLSTAAFWLVYLRCDGRPFLAAFVVLAAAVAAAPFWGVRPQTVSLFLTSAFLFLLNRYRRSNDWRSLIWLAPLMLVWVNSHGSFALGPVLILMYLAAALAERLLQWNADAVPPPPRARPLAALFLLCLALVALNPNGLALYPYPIQTLASGVIQTYIQEWQAPELFSQAVLPFTMLLALTLGALAGTRRRMDLASILLLVGFTLASLRAARQISIWVLIAAPILAGALITLRDSSPAWASLSSTGSPASRQRVLNALVLAIFAGAVLLRIGMVIQDQPAAERKYFPVAAVDWMQENGIRGPLFNQYDWGGYLIGRLYPSERVFIDGRSDLYGLTDDLVVREYFTAFHGRADWQAPLQRYQVRTVIVAPDAPLAAVLRTQPDWHLGYQDSGAMVFIRE